MKKVTLTVALSILLTSGAMAQTTTTTSSLRDYLEQIKEQRSEMKNDIQAEREGLKQMIQTQMRQFATSSTSTRRALFDDIKAEREALRARIDAERAELQTRIQGIRDEAKRTIVSRVGDRLNALNERMTEHFGNVLDHLSRVLERITDRSDRADGRGLDVSNVEAAIDAAEDAIADAQAAALIQAGKTYAVALTTEEHLRADVQGARQTLHTDLADVREIVRAAFEAVRNAATTLAQIDKPTSTPTSSTSSTST